MNSRRTIILLVAIVVGALASFGLLTYVRGLEADADADAQLASVWMITQDIPRGTPGDSAIASGFIVEQQVPVEFMPATAVSDPSVELTNKVAIADLPANTALVQDLFVLPSVISTGVTDRLEEKEMVTFTFSVDDVRGVAGMVQPGDYVNLIKLPGDETGEATATAETSGIAVAEDGAQSASATVDVERSPYKFDVRYVYQRAEVLAVGDTLAADIGDATTGPDGEPIEPVATGSGLITLAVPPEAVQLLLAIDLNELYVSLVPSTYVPRPLPQPDYPDLLPAEDETRLTPYGAEAPEAADGADAGSE